MALRLFAAFAVMAVAQVGAQQPAAKYHDMFGSWSPDGRKIALTSDRSGDPEIYVANADGSGLQRLTNVRGRDAHPSWSRDGKTIFFQSPRAVGHVQIYRMNANGLGQRRMAATAGFCGVPTASPDGRRIAFQCSKSLKDFGSARAPWRIHLLVSGSGVPRAVTKGPGNDQVPSWLPNGRRLMFHSDRSGINQLYETDLAADTTRQLTFGPASHSSGAYSPDGKRIALMRAEPGKRADVYVLGPGKKRVRITDSGPEFGTPAWSPDGKRLLIQKPTPGGVRLFVAPSDGSAKPRMIAFR